MKQVRYLLEGLPINRLFTHLTQSVKQTLSWSPEFIPFLVMARNQFRTPTARNQFRTGANDLWIAAHALTEGYVLVTNNVKEFSRISELTIENWAE